MLITAPSSAGWVRGRTAPPPDPVPFRAVPGCSLPAAASAGAAWRGVLRLVPASSALGAGPAHSERGGAHLEQVPVGSVRDDLGDSALLLVGGAPGDGREG